MVEWLITVCMCGKMKYDAAEKKDDIEKSLAWELKTQVRWKLKRYKHW